MTSADKVPPGEGKEIPLTTFSTVTAGKGTNNAAGAGGVGTTWADYLLRSMPFLLAIVVLFNPIPRSTTITEAAYYLSLVFTGILVIFAKRKMDLGSPLTIPILAYFSWAVLGLCWTLDVTNTSHHVVAHLLKVVVFYFIWVNFVRGKVAIERLGGALVLAAIALTILLLYHHFALAGLSVLDKLVSPFPETPTNWVGFTLVAGVAMVFPFFRKGTGWLRGGGILALALLFLLTYITQSRATGMAILLTLVVMMLAFNKKKLLVVLLVGMVIFGLGPIRQKFASQGLDAGNYRLATAYASWLVMLDYPLGVGYGNEIYANHLDLKSYHRRVPEKFQCSLILTDPHSLLLSIGVRLGFVGVFLFLAVLTVFLAMCRQLIRQKRDLFGHDWGAAAMAGLLGFLVIALFEPSTSHYVDVVLFSILGIGTSAWNATFVDQDIVSPSVGDRL